MVGQIAFFLEFIRKSTKNKTEAINQAFGTKYVLLIAKSSRSKPGALSRR